MSRSVLLAIELLILSALILSTRCANYQEVFVDGKIYFTDADCYARMTRVRMCAERPGLIIRHHDFENFPQGTTPHTTAPLDYLIVTLSILLKPFTAQPLDLAGALISPLVALIGGWFLWWWSKRMKFRYRWAMLIVYAISPILAHGTELGRPDHQSLLILLVTIGICAEWRLRIGADEALLARHGTSPSDWRTGRAVATTVRNWSVISGIAWSLALWVSLYEPLIMFALILVFGLTKDRQFLFGEQRRIGWIVFATIVAIALLVERRLPMPPGFQSSALFNNWAHSIGELGHVSPLSRIWLEWAGYLTVVTPILICSGWSTRFRSATAWQESRTETTPIFVVGLLLAMFLLTIWQARWSYFFVVLFAIALPGLLGSIQSRAAVWIAFGLSTLPILQFWDARIWPNESELAARLERRSECKQLRDLAIAIQSAETRAFFAPWWLSPSISYWSGQPAVAGSSHESLPGIVDSAGFFLTEDLTEAREILENRQVQWVFAYDWDRVGQNSADLLGAAAPDRAIGRILDRAPVQAPAYLVLAGQNGTAKLFRFAAKL